MQEATQDIQEEGMAFLETVKEKLKQKLAQLYETLLDGQKEIDQMQEYFWDNYTEMDEYGYEYYDNQQALLQQVNANQNTLSMKHRLESLLDSPFFGRVDFLYDGDEEPESFYIGIANFAEDTGRQPLIYDWRAPVSSLFYDYDKGNASYEAPAGIITGEITAKGQYKIKKGKIIYAFESDMLIDDEILKQELGSNGDVQLKSIIRTIQKEQNEIIRNTKDQILIIQGAAGSGKTSIALHRIAYLLYHDRKNLKSSNILILSPNSVFSDYISHILPELGEENIQEMSFDIFAYKELKEFVYDCEDRYHQLERQLHDCPSSEIHRYRYKQSFDFIGQMEGFLAVLEDRLIDFHDIEWRGYHKSEEDLIQLFYFKFQDTPILVRMDAIKEYFIDEVETSMGRDLKEDEHIYFDELFDKMYQTKDLYIIYNWFLEDIDSPVLPKVSYERRILKYEDVYPMLYLKYRLYGKKQHHRIKHVVIDEMQDYSYLQYTILQTMFDCKMTVLGDKAQSMDEQTQDVLAFLPKIFGKQVRKIVMNKSYRNTVEIAKYAAGLTGICDLELFDRHGKDVVEKTFSSVESVISEILKNINLDKYETAAVLARTEKEAFELYSLLKRKDENVSYMDRDTSVFQKGLTITTYYLAKGLEFDQVFTVRSDIETNMSKQADYICATRALHELYMYTLENNK